jgi:type IV secretory pathway VirB10-like protein
VLEAGFLVLLALVVGIADLDPLLIILVMAIGWLLVSLIEYFAWRQVQGASIGRFEAAPAAVVDEEMMAEDMPPPPPPPPPPEPEPAPPPDEETIVAPAPVERQETVEPPAGEREETVAEADDRVTAARKSFTDRETADRKRHSLDPLQPRPRRRWILFGPYERREAPAEDDREEEQ